MVIEILLEGVIADLRILIAKVNTRSSVEDVSWAESELICRRKPDSCGRGSDGLDCWSWLQQAVDITLYATQFRR